MDEPTRLRSIHELDLTRKEPAHPSPADWRDQFIYFLLIDRFDDGRERPPYDNTRRVRSLEDRTGLHYQGGTLRGIMGRLDYIQSLGATTVWLSPVLKNRPESNGSYHGYATQDFLAIDERIGTKDDLIELVRAAHARGMYVILDIIINHTGDNWAYKDDSTPLYRKDGTTYEFGYWRSEHPEGEFGPDDAVWPAELQSSDCYKCRGSIVNWNDSEESLNGDFLNLKELNLANPVVLETMQEVYKYWIALADLDGYRIDTVKHVEDGAAASFCNSIKEYAVSIGKKNFFMFGEIVAGDETLQKYVGPRTTGGEKLLALDAALDFPLYFFFEEVIKGFASPQMLRERYERLRRLYPSSDASEFFVTFVDNHDQMARPYRRFLHGGADPQQAVLALGYLLTSPGIPSLYYGTEQGFDGGAPPGPWHDAFIRECMFGGEWGAFGTTGMHFFNTEHLIYTAIAHIARIRSAEPALRYGRFYFREVSDDGRSFGYPVLGWGMLAYSRVLDNDELLILLNLRNETVTNYANVDWAITPPGTMVANLLTPETELLVEERSNRAAVQVTLPPYSIGIFKRKA